MKQYATGLFLAGLLGACASTPSPDTPTNDSKTRSTPGPSELAKTTPATTSSGQQMRLLPHHDPSNPLSQKRSVYFDFDQYVVKDEYRPIAEAHGRYLGENQTLKVKIEGNADERGSREYNLALGQKRAEAVKKVLTLIGANESQIETMSWGKEKPKALDHDEAAWAENRRADVKYRDDK